MNTRGTGARQAAGRPRGRRAGGNDTRAAIADAARHQFGTLGYRRTSLRTIAACAGVDLRLVAHYFGSKQELFIAVVHPPFEPQVVLDQLLAAGQPGVGRRLAEFIVSIWKSSDALRSVTGIIRAAASEEQATDLIRDLVTHHLLVPLAVRVGSNHPELRASLIASQVVGLMMARHIIGLNPLLSAPNELLVNSLAPVFEYYLNAELDTHPQALGGRPSA